MAKIFETGILVLGLLCWLAGCKEPFEPIIEARSASLLVVEGYIDAGPNAVTTIKLSRTYPLTGSEGQVNEADATVFIEGETEGVYPLTETSNGVYTSAALSLAHDQAYRIRIKTDNGEEYTSALTPVKVTPAIEEVFWKWEEDGINIYVSTQDPQNKTTYYKWTYEETWQIQTELPALYKYENGQVIARPEQEVKEMRNCWASSRYDDILLGSTAKYTKDTIRASMVVIPHRSEKTFTKYSILVKQRALSQKEYQFLDLMKKNSSELGSFFDPQPSELRGNLSSVNTPEQLVVGFVGAYTTSQQRIFISKNDLPPYTPGSCIELTGVEVFPSDINSMFGAGGFIPYKINYNGLVLKSYEGAAAFCLDCRLRGSSVKPDFWE